MKKTFTIGYTPDGHAVKVPVDVVTQTVAVLARKDGGKTWTAMLLAENLLDVGAQVVVVESVGKYWALRVGKNGRSRGKDIAVLGGKKGDVPLSPDAGKLVAKALVEHRISAVLDLTFMRKGQRRKFLAEFGEELLHLKQQQEPATPLHLIIEEAQTVIPQMTRAGGPEENRMLGAFEDIVRIGRNAAIGVTMISQRPQSVNKEALSQTELLIALGVNEVPARKAIEAWVQEKGANREIIGELPGLAQGEAIVWSPSWLRFFGRVRIAERTTYDSTATAKLGRRRAVGKLPKSNQKQLLAVFEQAMKLAEREDPTALRRRVVELEAEVRKTEQKLAAKWTNKLLPKEASVKPPPPAVLGKRDLARVKKVHAAVVHAMDHMRELALSVTREVDTFAQVARDLEPKLKAVFDPPQGLRQLRHPIPITRTDTVVFDTAERRFAVAPKPSEEHAEGDLSEYAQRLLTTLAQRHPMALSRPQIAILSGRSTGSSAFAGAMAELQRRQLIEGLQGRYTLTDAGREAAGPVEAPKSPEALRQHWLHVLPDYERSLLAVALEHYPNAVPRDVLGQAAGKSITSSAFAGAISTLVKNELFTIPSLGAVKASDTLFQRAS